MLVQRDLPNDTKFVSVSMSDACAKEFNALCAGHASVPELEIEHDFLYIIVVFFKDLFCGILWLELSRPRAESEHIRVARASAGPWSQVSGH